MSDFVRLKIEEIEESNDINNNMHSIREIYQTEILVNGNIELMDVIYAQFPKSDWGQSLFFKFVEPTTSLSNSAVNDLNQKYPDWQNPSGGSKDRIVRDCITSLNAWLNSKAGAIS